MKPLVELFQRIGDWGHYQARIYFLVCLSAIPGGIHTISYVFTAATPRHRCYVPVWDASNAGRFEIPQNDSKYYIPTVEKDGERQLSSCEMFSTVQNSTTDPAACSRFVYDRSVYLNTIVSEFNLVCDRSALVSTTTSLFMLGLFLGSVIFGIVADRYGRRTAMIYAVIVGSFAGLGNAFSPDYFTFTATRIIIAATVCQFFLIGFVIAVELVGATYRVFTGVMIEIFFASGEVLVGAIALFIRDWRTLQLVASLTLPLTLLVVIYLPESVRWLYSKGEFDRAERIVARIASENHATVPKQLLAALRSEEKLVAESEPKDSSIFRLLERPLLRRRFIAMIIQWIIVATVYYGLSLDTQRLGGNDFINSMSVSAIEIPSYTLVILLLDRCGRKAMLFASFFLGGMACIAVGIVPASMHTLVLALALLGKFGISAAYAIVYVYAAELFPTDYRSQCIGLFAAASRFGSVFSPFIGQLGDVARFLPYAIFGAAGIVASVFVLMLPETSGHQLPETLAEAESIGGDGGVRGADAADEDQPLLDNSSSVSLRRTDSVVSLDYSIGEDDVYYKRM